MMKNVICCVGSREIITYDPLLVVVTNLTMLLIQSVILSNTNLGIAGTNFKDAINFYNQGTIKAIIFNNLVEFVLVC